MKVNGKHISLFGAKLVDYSISGTPLTQHTSDITKYGVINKYGTKATNKKIIINLVFKATWFPPLHYNPSMRERLNKVAEQITQFDSELINCDTVTIELPNGYTYLCIPTALGTAADDGSSTHDSSYTFTGIQAMPMITVQPNNGVINCRSNTETDCIITVSAKDTIESSTVYDITIKSLKENDVVVIDGIKKTVLCNGFNKFADVELTSFPTLLPGENSFSVDPSDKLEVSVSYYPTFI